ncbi:MAG: filamentous hemagglutinin N-terminal domain-containing protein [Brasilonema octagenarum HA4186-MV1]|jgi:filamentous hemagglutinin family protein|nr:filamentous hemagglutinin N-terminal domain-containing protein [Brasilonema octagenarum HA4186-MV1]
MLSKKKVRHPIFFFALPVATLASLSYLTIARAQITPDNSLGGENSVVAPNVDIKGIPSDRIDGGATRGANLFHSFQEFNVNAGRGAYFSNPAGIANILTRVTGGNVSNIQGVLGVLGNANLFFINPNGILFGPNARLDVGGSFLGSTANSLIFKNNFEFSATNPQAPPLLTINVPIGLGFRNNPGTITNQSNQPTIVDNSGNPIGLTVPEGNSLALVGGDINSDDGRITLRGGRVELGGLAGAGTVGLDVSGNTFKLNFPNDSLLSNITLANDARVAVRGNGGGDIVVNANNFTATYGGRLTAGTEGVGNAGDITVNVNNFNISGVGQSGLGAGVGNQTVDGASGNAGNIFINSKSFNASSGAVVRNQVLAGSQGDGGNINITTGSLSLIDAASLDTNTYGQGNAGNVSVRASGSVEFVYSDIYSTVERGAVGNGGNIDIKAANLSLKDGAQLQTLVRGKSETQPAGRGNAGNVSVSVTGPVTIAGVKNGFASGIRTFVEAGAVGNGGNITISSGEFSLTDGARLNASTFGQGNAGNVTVDVKGPITIARVKDGFSSAIFSDVETGATGNGGNVTIISSGSFSLSDGAQLSASTLGQGNAGSVSVRVSGAVELAGSNTAIFSTVEAGGEGKGGNIDIKAATLSLKDGAQLLTSVREAFDTQSAGKGDAGNVSVSVTGPVTISGVKDGLSSAIFSRVNTGATGNAGNITISSASFSLSDGAQLAASTRGQGNAGSVSVQVSGAVSLAGSNTTIFSTVEAGGVGKGGNIDIKAATFSLKDGAQLQTAVREEFSPQPAGRGDAGNVTVDVTGSVTISGVKNGLRSGIFSLVSTGAVGNGGDIKISSGSFSLSDGAQLIASTYGQGNAGNVLVRASGAVDLAGSNTYIFSNVESGAVGNGGNINIKAASLSLKDGAQLQTIVRRASDTQLAGRGDAGNVTVDVTGPVTIAGVGNEFASLIGSAVDTGATGNGGNIAISSGSFSLSDGAQLNASTFGQGDAGNININAASVSLKDNAQITTSSTSNNGAAGDIEVIARSIRLDNESIIKADTVAGQGNITLSARDYVLLRRGSRITTNATGTATGGNITINAGNLVAFPSENSDITAKAQQSSGGRITINTKGGIFGIEYRPQETPLSDITASSDLGLQFSGIVQINTPDIDPTRGLFELTEAVVDPAQQVAQNPCTKGYGSSFTITGRGGLPTDPNKILSSNNVRVDLIQPVAITVGSTNATQKQPSQKPPVKQITPVQGWIYNEKGQVVLVGYDPTKTGPQREQPAPTSNCAAVK